MSNEDLLINAKTQFCNGVLANDVLAQLVLTTLTSESNVDRLLGFMAEPWRPVNNETGQPRLGMRFNMSATNRQNMLGVAFTTFQYLEVLTMTVERGERTLLTGNSHLFFDASDAFMALEVSIEEKRRAALQFMTLWQQFCQTMKMLGAHVDSMSATFTTEVNSYCVE